MKRKTLRKHKDFIILTKDLSISIDKVAYVRAKPTQFVDDARYGVLAQKRLFKLAVQRNRAKRLLRDWIAFNEELMLPELDYVFIANDGILDTSRENGRESIKKALVKIKDKYEKSI